MNKNYAIRISSLTDEAYYHLEQLDQTFVGTSDYMGLAYFWAYEYRHYLRDASFFKRRIIHQKFLKQGVAVNGESEVHLAIICRVLNKENQNV